MNLRNMLPSPPPVRDELWTQGLDNQTIQVGDLWVASWDDVDLGLVLVSGVHNTHVTVWPVTDEVGVTPAAPSFHIEAGWLERPLACWPEAQAGMSQAALSRRVGTVLTARDIRAVLADVWEPGDAAHASVAYYSEVASEEADDSLDLACRFGAMLSDLDTPHADSAPVGVLSEEFKAAHRLSSPRDVTAHVRGIPAQVVSAFNADRLLTQDEIGKFAAAYDTDPRDVVTHPEDATVTALRQPKWKPSIARLMSRSDVAEAEARLLVWERAKVAARQTAADSDAAIDARIAHAFEQLLSP